MELKTKKFVGTWRHDDSVVEYSISIHGNPLTVTGIDVNDGEDLLIEDVRFDGSELSFTSFCPSTSYRLRHIFRPARGANQIEHEYTRTEKWQRAAKVPK
jgi:hypothetical protein